MVRDRLPDLCARRRNDRIERGFLPDIFKRVSQNIRVQCILEDAGKIRKMLDLLQENVNIIKNSHANNLSHINTDIQTTLESQTFIISQLAFQIRNELDMRKESISTPAVDEKEDDDQQSNLFIENFLEDTKEAILQLSELESRHADLIKLEKSLVEIRDMFSELAFSVEKQGEQVDCVEYFAGQATDQVDNGRYTISRAEKKRNKNRKRKIKFFIFLAVVILIFLIIIFL